MTCCEGVVIGGASPQPKSSTRRITSARWADLPRSPTRKEPDTSEDQVKRVACDLVAHLELDPCELESVQRLSCSQPASPSTTGGEWGVRFAFEPEDAVACSSEVALVIVDDATEQARLVDSL